MSAHSKMCIGLFFCFGMVVVPHARAQTPLGSAFTYQGQLMNAGSPASGLHDLRFRLYDALAGGAQVGAALCADNVSVADGLFTLSLDFGAQFAGQERFLEFDVRADAGLNCGNGAGFVTLSPRQALTAAPNALFASNADQLDGLNSTAFLQTIPVPLTLTGTNTTHIIQGVNASNISGAAAVFGLSTDTTQNTYGVRGQTASTAGRGVVGFAPATSGFTRGVFGESNSNQGTGVFGGATAGTGTTYGVYGESDSGGSGSGVYGRATAGTGTNYGGNFWNASDAGIGVHGRATATTGNTYGGYFRTDSTGGYGIFGFATATTGNTYGVYGQSASLIGRGVYGVSTANGVNYGVYGESVFYTGVYGSGGFVGVRGEGYDGVSPS